MVQFQLVFFCAELEQDVEWLKEAGFTSVVNRYRGKFMHAVIVSVILI